jgi:hypothetical protein
MVYRAAAARLVEAVAVYRAALEKQNRPRLPLERAAMQDDLGSSLLL